VSSPVVVVVVVLGATRVEVVGGAVVVVGRTVELVGAIAGLRPAVAAGSARRGARVVVEDSPAKRLRSRRVVDGASASASSPGAGAVTNPIRVPPAAPSTTATASVAQRRSMVNRTVCSWPRLPIR
jgi:hypothetical protein